MSQDMLQTLQAIDTTLLTDVVRQDQRSPTLEILDWSVKRLSDKGIMNPDGLFLFSGQGRDERGTKSWSVVLKILKDPAVEIDTHNLWYWKRELLAVQSGLLERLPGPVATPRFYGVSEAEGSGWIWMEHIIAKTEQPWGTNQYVFAARELGRFHGSCLSGVPLLDYPWLTRDQMRTWVDVNPVENAWDSPFVSKAFPSQTRERILRVWDERERFYDTLDRLPQVFSHLDFHRRNLHIRQLEDGKDQLVAVDWAWCGYGPLGADLFKLVGNSAFMFAIEPETIPDIEPRAFEAYLAGLRDTGWAGNPELVHLGYSTWFAIYLSTGLPAGTANLTAAYVTQQFGRSREKVASSWAYLCELALDRADEARRLMDRLL